jgi:predicted nucleic acid-binding protein
MILVDTSVIVAWLDENHEYYHACTKAITDLGNQDTLAVSSVTFAELAVAGRTREALQEDFKGWEFLELDFESAYVAGQAFARYRPKRGDLPVLPDFFIRAQAQVFLMPHLTNDERRTIAFPNLDWLFVKKLFPPSTGRR